MAAKKQLTDNGGELSLPSFRDGIAFKVEPLNFGGIKKMLKAEGAGSADMIESMLFSTLKMSFPNVTVEEIDNLKQPDFVKLLQLVTSANSELSAADFTIQTPEK